MYLPWYEVQWSGYQAAWIASGLFGAEDIALVELCVDRDTCIEGNIYENSELLETEA